MSQESGGSASQTGRSNVGPRTAPSCSLRGALQAGLLAIGTVVVALGAAEIALRLFFPPVRRHYVLAPGTERTTRAAPEIIPGVFGINHYRINDLGIRGPLFGDERAEYRILAVGGSTTECAILDDTKAWPYLLGLDLGSTGDGRRVWVGNVGRSGATSRDNVLHLKYLLRELPHLNAVVVLVGANDLQSALQEGWNYRLPAPITDPLAERQRLPLAFTLLPGRLQDSEGYYGTSDPPWYKTTALWQLARRARIGWHEWRFFDLKSEWKDIDRARRRRHDADLLDSLPPLASPLIEFRRNLNAMVDITRAARVRLVFLTQPSMWREVMSPAEQRLFWLAPNVGKVYFATGALARGMAIYNAALKGVCKDRGVECVDVASDIPRDTSMMVDAVHFTEAGSRRLAQDLATYMKSRPPWTGSSSRSIGLTPVDSSNLPLARRHRSVAS